MKKLVAFFTIICCFSLVACGAKEDVKTRLGADAERRFSEVVETEIMPEMRRCGIEDLTADVVLEDSYYDEGTKTYKANVHLLNFKSQNSLVRLSEDKKSVETTLDETFKCYKNFGGKTYEWSTEQGEVIKLDIHIKENTKFYVSDASGKGYGIDVDLDSGATTFVEIDNVSASAWPDVSSTSAPKKEKNKKNKKITASNNSMECPFCGVSRKCSRCGSKNVEYCGDYYHYCNSCWREIRDHEYDYWDDDSCDDCGDWECDGSCEDYDDYYDEDYDYDDYDDDYCDDDDDCSYCYDD